MEHNFDLELYELSSANPLFSTDDAAASTSSVSKCVAYNFQSKLNFAEFNYSDKYIKLFNI
jgi:hypothetical protein